MASHRGPISLSNAIEPLQIDSGGLVIGQDQDSVGGGFNENQDLVGTLSDFTIWRRQITLTEVARLSGTSKGLPTWTNATPSAPVAGISESRDFQLVYDAPLGTGSITYDVDNSANINFDFDRVAYFMELDDGTTSQWVYVSMDAFTDDATKLGLPNGFVWDIDVANMNVFASPNANVTTGIGIQTGNLEIWPSNYSQGANGVFDFDDAGFNTNNGYGSFQIHNHDVNNDGSTADGETILAYNHHRDSNADIGIGSQPTGETRLDLRG